jgi:hypothetical protein
MASQEELVKVLVEREITREREERERTERPLKTKSSPE